MKKLLIVALALFVGAQAHAQLAAEAGYQHAFERWEGETQALNGLFAGAKYTLNLDDYVPNLSIEPGLNLSLLFGKEDQTKESLSEVAVNLPIHVRYSYELSDNILVYGLAGPTFQEGLLNKVGSASTYKEENDSHVVRKPFQVYLGFGGGAELFEQVRINLGVDFGLLNMADSKASDESRIRRIVFRVGAAYLF